MKNLSRCTNTRSLWFRPMKVRSEFCRRSSEPTRPNKEENLHGLLMQ